MVQQVSAEVPPVQLAEQGIGALLAAGRRGRTYVVPYLPRTQLTEMQVRRQPRRALEVRAISEFGIVTGNGAGGVQPLECAAFTRRPRLTQPPGPVRPGREQLETIDVSLVQAGRRRLESAGY